MSLPPEFLLTEQATDAARDGNWFVVANYLEQLLGIAAVPGKQDTSTADGDDDWQRSLFLALHVLKTGDFQARWEVAKLIPAFGEGAIAALVELLQEEEADEDARWFAARILGNLSHAAVIPALLDLWQNSSSLDLQTIAAEALAHQGKQAIAVLVGLLDHPETRLLAVQALAQIRNSETIPALLTVVQDPEPAVRAAALEALSSFHDRPIPSVLVAALKDVAATVRQIAIRGLSVRADLARELNLVAVIGDRLWDVNPTVCQEAAIALGRLGGEEARVLLSRALAGPVAPLNLQLVLVQALARIGTDTALACLIESFCQPGLPAQVRYEIITLLGRWPQPSLYPLVADALIGLLQLPLVLNDAGLKSAIALALGQLQQPTAMDWLINLLAEPNQSLRLHAIAALKALDAHGARQRLTSLMQQGDASDPLWEGAAIALREW